ncbi:MAG TPA: hypothetical protein VFI27_11010 [candidate division Zixibacteria bacterium]|nr:hypothetical protein [candidate division Zixibacteria bacterium]
MSKDVLFYGWNRAVPGREAQSAGLFQEFLQYLGGLEQEGAIDSFETVLLSTHGGDLNGFILIRGDRVNLDEVERREEWITYLTRAGLIMDGGGLIPGVTGEGVMEWMARWTSLLQE